MLSTFVQEVEEMAMVQDFVALGRLPMIYLENSAGRLHATFSNKTATDRERADSESVSSLHASDHCWSDSAPPSSNTQPKF